MSDELDTGDAEVEAAEVLTADDAIQTSLAPERRPPTRLAPHQFDFVAMAMENGVPSDEIARAVGCMPDYIIYLSKGGNESFNRIRDGYRHQLLTETVAWRFKLAAMLPLGYAAIQRALNNERDGKLAFDASKWLLEAVIPQIRPQPSTGPAVQMNFGANAQVQTQLADTLVNVLNSFTSMRAHLATGDDPHVKRGSDALIRLGSSGGDTPDAPLVGAKFANGNGSGNGGSPQPTPTDSEQEPSLGEPVGSA